MALWSGRFSGKMDPAAWYFNASIGFDQRMALEDVMGSLAWASQLAAIGVITQNEYKHMEMGLTTIQSEFENDLFEIQAGDEDIHSAVERRLYELIGEVAGKLHTGRSRNDQVATDFRLWVLNHIPVIFDVITQMQQSLLNRAEADFGLIMPAYTHLQRAQPVLVSHWWLSTFWALERDQQRWQAVYKNASVLPLGSGAVAGSGFAINRLSLAEQLGFESISQNSMDAVSDRDFAAEFLFAASMTAVHLSKFAEGIILFSTREFDYLALDDAFATGSSLMPQKKNPDVFELARGKTGSMIGLLTGLLTTLKGLPSTYDKDLQEDKAPVFAAFDYLTVVIPVLAGALDSLTLKPENMEKAIDSTMFATDLADALVREGIPFREAHGLAAKAVRSALESGVGLDQLSQEKLVELGIPAKLMDKDLFSTNVSINHKNLPGGTGTQAVRKQMDQAQWCINQNKKFFGGKNE
jgi:argininosuccinate lyase